MTSVFYFALALPIACTSVFAQTENVQRQPVVPFCGTASLLRHDPWITSAVEIGDRAIEVEGKRSDEFEIRSWSVSGLQRVEFRGTFTGRRSQRVALTQPVEFGRRYALVWDSGTADTDSPTRWRGSDPVLGDGSTPRHWIGRAEVGDAWFCTTCSGLSHHQRVVVCLGVSPRTSIGETDRGEPCLIGAFGMTEIGSELRHQVGTANLRIPIPHDDALAGETLFVQWAYLEDGRLRLGRISEQTICERPTFMPATRSVSTVPLRPLPAVLESWITPRRSSLEAAQACERWAWSLRSEGVLRSPSLRLR